MNINGREIGVEHPPYVIAEMSCNHGGEIYNAFRIVEEAATTGVDAVKVQAYTPDSLCVKGSYNIPSGTWAGRNLYDLYEKTAMPMEWLYPIFKLGENLGITIFSSVYCFEGLAELERLNCPAYKIASFEANHIELLEAVRNTGKPVILSTGAIADWEVQTAVNIFDHRDLALLHCVSSYPTNDAFPNL